MTNATAYKHAASRFVRCGPERGVNWTTRKKMKFSFHSMKPNFCRAMLYATRASLQLLRSVRIGKQRLCRPVGRSVGRTPMFIGAVQRTELSAGTAQLSSSCNQRPRRETRTSSAASPARQRLQSKTIIISLIYIVLLLRRIAEVGRSVGRPASS